MNKRPAERVRAYRVHGLGAARRRALAGSALALLTAFGAGTAHGQAALPTGGTVVSGSATIASGASAVTVTQTTGKAIVNWNSFDVGATNSVTFVQPDANSTTLNRVTGTTSSIIAGKISSNGAVYLVNPNGIAITATGKVRTAGGFVASTLDIADSDFNAGNLKFRGKGASAGVSNAGQITPSQGAYVALLGGSVSNSGTISVALGKVGLGSGERVVLDLNGDGFMQVAVPTSAITGGNAALVDMTGTIAANGGRVQLSAATVKDAVRNVINMSGGISADSAVGDGGTIILLGGDGGTVTARGTLTARATGTTGNGGFVETSGATVDFTGLKVDTSAARGAAGTWLIDPTDLTVDNAAAATISANLATGNVTLQTNSDGTTSGPGNTSVGNGDINVNSAIAWNSANTLSLLAYNNINLNAAITGSTGGLTLSSGNAVANTGSIGASGAVTVGLFSLTNGNWTQNVATLPAFAATDFRFTVGQATFLRATGGTGASGTPYVLTDIYGLQGMASRTYLSASFALANDIDASGTVSWGAGAGFTPIGTSFTGSMFTGSFDGRRNVIRGLRINRTTGDIGLFGDFSGSVANVGLVGGTVNGGSSAVSGALIGSMTGGSVTGSYATTNVSGYYAGGLIGNMRGGAVTYSYATGLVTGTIFVGGLVGYLQTSTVSNDYATGAVTGGTSVGGLVGRAASGGGVISSYATGAVTGTNTTTSGADGVGGLIGLMDGGSVASSYATGTTSGLAGYTGGALGYHYSGSVTGLYWDSYSTGQTLGIGKGSTTGSFAVTSDPAQSAAANYAYKAAAYANLTAASGIGTATPTGFAYVAGDSTRPFLAFEVPTSSMVATNASGQLVLTNSHQLQLIGYDGVRLSGSYALGNGIDLSETGRVVLGTPGSYAGMWAGTGFVSIGTDGAGNVWTGTAFGTTGNFTGFTGNLDGGGFTVGGLTIKRTMDYQGLIGFASGTTAVNNIGLVGVNINIAGGGTAGGLVGYLNGGSIGNAYATGSVSSSGANYVGGLVGISSGAISNSYSTATASGNAYVGGLVGYMLGTGASVTNAHASGAVTSTTAFSALAGGLVGDYSATTTAITNSYATGSVSAQGYDVGGLIGYMVGAGAGVSDAYATGAVSTTSTSTSSYVGGLIGLAASTSENVNNVYATGAVSSAGGVVGGLIGGLNASSGSTITNAYATGSVNGTANVGGLIGRSGGNTVNYAYASGAVTGTGTVGGLIGSPGGGGAVTNSYWDSYSTGQANAFGSGTPGSTVVAVTSDPAQSVAGNYAYTANAYANLAAASGLGTATPSGFVFMAGDSTRPFLAFEVPTSFTVATNAGGALVLVNSHQLQLIGYGAANGGSYSLGSNIDLAETGAVVTGTPSSYSGMWAASGFVPIGTDGTGLVWNGTGYMTLASIAANGAHGFTGSLDGGGYTVSNLTSNRAGGKDVGLFGLLSGSVRNVNVTGKLSGFNGIGGLVGLLYTGGSVSGASSSANVTGNNLVGGLVGNQLDGSTITTSSASGTVTGVSDVGGLVGYASGATISRSFATGNVNGTNYAGGLVGYQYNTTAANTYASGAVTASSLTAGGLVGVLYGGTVTNSYSVGAVSAPSHVGGLIGDVRSGGTVTSSYWDTQTSGQATSAGGNGRTTAQMQDPATYVGWDFASTWLISSNTYPRLRVAP